MWHTFWTCKWPCSWHLHCKCSTKSIVTWHAVIGHNFRDMFSIVFILSVQQRVLTHDDTVKCMDMTHHRHHHSREKCTFVCQMLWCASESTSQHWPLKMNRVVMSPNLLEQHGQIEKWGMVSRHGSSTLICWKRNHTVNITLSLFHCMSQFHLHWSKVCWDASCTRSYFVDALSYGCAVSWKLECIIYSSCLPRTLFATTLAESWWS